jgi:hypothetical protein
MAVSCDAAIRLFVGNVQRAGTRLLCVSSVFGPVCTVSHTFVLFHVNNSRADAKVYESIFLYPLMMMKKPSSLLLLLAIGTAFCTDAIDVKSKQKDLVEESTRRTEALGKIVEAANKGTLEEITSKGPDAGSKPAARNLSGHTADSDNDAYNGGHDTDDYYNGNNNDAYNGHDNDAYNGKNNDAYDENNDAYNGNNDAYNGKNNDAYNGNNNDAYNGHDNDAYNGNNDAYNGDDNGAYNGNNDAYNGDDNGAYNGHDNGAYNGNDNYAYDGHDNGHYYGNPYGDTLYGSDVDCDADPYYDNDAYKSGNDNDSPYDITQYESKVGPYSNHGDGYGDIYDYDCRCPCEGSADVKYGVQVDIYDIFYGNPLPQAPCDLPVDTICVSDYRAIELIIDSPVIFQCRRFGYCLHNV